MSVMDLKSKGITWVGGVYGKFGAIWDNAEVASKEAVQYVEGQAKSVNKFCTTVVEGLLPRRGDPLNNEGQGMPDIGTHVEEIISTEDCFVDTGIEESHIETEAVDATKDQFGELDLLDKHISPSMDYVDKVESALSLEQPGDVSRNEKSDVVIIEQNGIEDKSLVPEVELISNSEKESRKSSLLSDDNHVNSSSCLCDVSPSTSVHAKKLKSPSEVRMISSYFVDDWDCPAASCSGTNFIAVPCEKQVAEVGLVSPSGSLLAESEHLATNAVSCDDPVSFDVSFSDTSSAVSSKNDAVVVEVVASSSIPSLESVVASGNGRVRFCEPEKPEAFISFDNGFSEDLSDIITDPDMETIDLLDEVKAKESCVNVNSRELYAASQRAQKQRSYKKKMQDAFSSRKRLAKEYELLAIWFGDTDIGDTSHSHTFNPFIPARAASIDSTSSQTQHLSDSEWELI